jgi:protein-S-isoprenylcysteine O-methyltransferase Ste14
VFLAEAFMEEQLNNQPKEPVNQVESVKVENSSPEQAAPQNSAPQAEAQPVELPEVDNRPPRPFLYRYRGVILGILAVIALVCPAGDLDIVPFLIFVNIFIISVYLRIKARCCIGEHTRGSSQDAPVLVTWGAYGRMRHPLYVSNMAIGVSLIVLHFGLSPFVIPFVAILFAVGFRLAKLDDRYLETRYGDEWKLWAMHTPAFIPREIHVPGPRRSGKDAFLADMATWISLALMVGLVLFRKVDFLIWA